MALTRKMLKAMGIEDEKIDQIIEAHTEVTDTLKADREKYKADAEKLTTVEKELNDLKAKGDDGYKAKYEDEKKAHEKLKTDIAEKETKAAKDKALRAYFESKNITGKNLEIAMRASTAEFSAMELDGDKIKDTAAFDALIGENGALAGLVSTTQETGINTPNPPTNKLNLKDVDLGTLSMEDYIATRQKKG